MSPTNVEVMLMLHFIGRLAVLLRKVLVHRNKAKVMFVRRVYERGMVQ